IHDSLPALRRDLRRCRSDLGHALGRRRSDDRSGAAGDRRQVHDPIAPRGRSGDRHSRGRAAPTSSGPRMTHDPLARRGQRDWATIPNAITVLRLLLVIPITLLLANGAAPVVTLVLLALFGASDWVDGYLA